VRGLQPGGGGSTGAPTLRLLDCFAREVCVGRLKINNPWGDHVTPDLANNFSPINAAIESGDAALFSHVLSQTPGKAVAGAAMFAFQNSNWSDFSATILHKACIEHSPAICPALPLIFNLLVVLSDQISKKGNTGPQEAQTAMIIEFLRRWPTEARRRCILPGPNRIDLSVLDFAIQVNSRALVAAACELGAELGYHAQKRQAGVEPVTKFTTLWYLISNPDPATFEMLREAGALDWGRYTEEGKALVAGAIGRLLLLGNVEEKNVCLQILEAGFRQSWNPDDVNAIIDAVCYSLQDFETMSTSAITATTAQCIELLELGKKYGMDVKYYKKVDAGKALADTLLHKAVEYNSIPLCDWAITQGGCSPEQFSSPEGVVLPVGETGTVTPLFIAFFLGHKEVAWHLVLKHHAKLVVPGIYGDRQAIVALFGSGKFTDKNVPPANRGIAPFLSRFLEVEPSLLSPSWYMVGEKLAPWNPLALCVKRNRAHCLELCFANKLPGLHELSTQPYVAYREGGGHDELHLTQEAIYRCHWDVLKVLAKWLPTTWLAETRCFGPRGNVVGTMKSAAALFEEAVKPGGGSNPRREVALAVEKAIKAEQEAVKREKDLQKAAASLKEASEARALAVGAATNVFEDPRLKVGATAPAATEGRPAERTLSAAEEKKKAKKREQKKKAKAKKRAAAAVAQTASAGAGGKAAADQEEGLPSSTDSSGIDEEEAGMDEEERMLARAPTFDLEKERAARKAAREREEKERLETLAKEKEDKHEEDGGAGK
jgi:hypothetical protein